MKNTKKRSKIPTSYDNTIDILIGNRILVRRLKLKLSRQQICKSLQITPQQLRKYEHGMNRISASTLFQISFLLKVPIHFFFDFNVAYVKMEISPCKKLNKTLKLES
ncbi:MAG: helix-turn-helix transcriptional regulator [Alphaproteobacteria bacterium]|nr:helix-turn-helix transcriptional regulator [Alphaproteobacteria bacterium]